MDALQEQVVVVEDPVNAEVDETDMLAEDTEDIDADPGAALIGIVSALWRFDVSEENCNRAPSTNSSRASTWRKISFLMTS